MATFTGLTGSQCEFTKQLQYNIIGSKDVNTYKVKPDFLADRHNFQKLFSVKTVDLSNLNLM